MLDYIKGTVTTVMEQAVTVDVGGIGIQCQVPDASGYALNVAVTIVCYLHWNQEQGPSLYGFGSAWDRTLFCLLIGCSGIGPRLALTLMGQMSTKDLMNTIAAGNTKALSSLHGIGPKKADQLIMQLRPKVAEVLEAHPQIDSSSGTHTMRQLTQALESLHYSRQEISTVVSYLHELKQHDQPFDMLMRHALSYLSKYKAL